MRAPKIQVIKGRVLKAWCMVRDRAITYTISRTLTSTRPAISSANKDSQHTIPSTPVDSRTNIRASIPENINTRSNAYAALYPRRLLELSLLQRRTQYQQLAATHFVQHSYPSHPSSQSHPISPIPSRTCRLHS